MVPFEEPKKHALTVGIVVPLVQDDLLLKFVQFFTDKLIDSRSVSTGLLFPGFEFRSARLFLFFSKGFDYLSIDVDNS
jgi:hypothetical protein